MNSARPRNLTDIGRMARRHKTVLILPALVITVSCSLALWLMPAEYVASAVIVAEPSKTGGAGSQTPDLRLNFLRERVGDGAMISRLIDRQNVFRQARDGGVAQETIVADVRERIRVDVEPGRGQESISFRISFRALDPETARSVTADIVEHITFEAIPGNSTISSSEVDALRKRTNELASKLRELERKGNGASASREMIQTPAVSSGQRFARPSVEVFLNQPMNLESLKDQKYKLEQQISDSDRRIAAQRQIVDSQKKTSTPRDNPTYALLISRRAELQGQRNNLLNRQELTEKHPRVLLISDQIAAINTQLEELRRQDASALNQTPEARELLSLESERRKMQLELEVTGREINRRTSNPQPTWNSSRPPIQQTSGPAHLAQEYRILKQDYDDSAEKLKDAQASRESSGGARVERYRISEPAALAKNPDYQARVLLGILAAAIGLALGACFVFMLEWRRHRTLQDAVDVEYYTRLPMLAAIPRSLASTERHRIADRSGKLLAAGLAGAVFATVGLTKLLIVTQFFARITNR